MDKTSPPAPGSFPPSGDESQRLAVLRDYEILDTPPESAFERLTALAARLFRAPMALVVLADAERLWFKSAYGVNVPEIPRATTFCSHTILADELLVVADPTRDPRFADCFLVNDTPHARFYAGAPLRTASGHSLGTLCLMDLRPREFDEADRQLLRDLAAVTMDELELRREVRRRQRAEADLARDHERLRLLENVVVHANDAVLISEAAPVEEPGPRILYVNAAFERMTGYAAAEVLGRTPRFLQGIGTSPEARATIRRALRGEQPVQAELLNYRKDGTEFWVDLSIFPVTDEQGRFTHWVSVQRDVTGRRLAEGAIRRSEARNAAVLQTALDGIITMDGAGRIVEFNPAAEAMFGYQRAAVLGQHLDELIIPPEFRERHQRGTTAYLKTGVGPLLNRRVELPALRADNSRILVEMAVTRIPVEGAALFTAYLRDITENRRTERALRESQERYHRVTANVPGMVYQFVLRADGSMQFPLVSESCREIYGVEPEMAQRDADALLDLVPAEEREQFMQSIRTSAATLRPWHWEGTIVPSGGGPRKHLEVLSRPGRLENGDTVWDGLVLDVTEQHHHKEVRLAMEAAERANTAKSEFLSRMSHELRTPLNAILGFGQLLELDALDPKQRESTEHILRAGRHLLGLVDEVLDIARIESGHLVLAPERIELPTFLRETAELVTPLRAPLGITLEVQDLPPGVARTVLADPGRLKQILLNLLSNAIKYNRRGGQVRLGVEGREGDRRRLTVRDTGSGIAPELLAKLFTPFERLGAESQNVEGSGLGLAVAKRLAEAMGIKLGVESTPGVGSNFWIELPVADDTAGGEPTGGARVQAGDAAAVTSPVSPCGRPITLLYIEDNSSNLVLVEKLIARVRPEWRLLLATDAMRGLEMARTHPLDLILLDRQLPDLAGEEVLARLGADTALRQVPVVILSADASPAARARLLAGGARAYLTKPLEVASLMSTLDTLLAA